MTFRPASQPIVDARAAYGPATGILDDVRKPIFDGFALNSVSNFYTVCILLYLQ
jgi:hypothetical protein